MSTPVTYIDKNGREVSFDVLIPKDSETGASIFIIYDDHELHEGNAFVANHEGTLADGATLILAFKTPTHTLLHLLFAARASGEANVKLYEAPTYDAFSGTTHPAYNRNRTSKKITAAIDLSTNPISVGNITKDITNVAGGTVFYEEHFGAGKTTGGSSRGVQEFILKRDTVYVAILTSEAAGNDCELILDWNEHVDEGRR